MCNLREELEGTANLPTNRMRRLRAYPDTSVFGGCYDPEFEFASRRFFQEVANGRFMLVLSELTGDELSGAPLMVRQILDGIARDAVEQVSVTAECRELQAAYLQAGVVPQKSASDALHIACATVWQADIVVSWNFKHIVHFGRIAGFEGVNTLLGYRSPRIYSPQAVIGI
jgi:hypothetical protein